MGERRRDPKARAAIAAAMKDVIARAGTQPKAAEMLGIAQSRVSAIAKHGGAEVETLIAMRAVLGRSLDELVGLAPMGEPGVEVVLSLVTALAGRPPPVGGWKALLDRLATAPVPPELRQGAAAAQAAGSALEAHAASTRRPAPLARARRARAR